MEKLLLNPTIHRIVFISLCVSVCLAINYFLRLYLARKRAAKTKGFIMQVVPPKYQPEEEANKQGTRFALQRFMDNLTASLKQERISFEIFADNSGIKFLIWTATKQIQELVKLNLYSTYRERIKIVDLKTDPLDNFREFSTEVDEYKALKHEIYSLMDVKDFEAMDPIQNLLGAMTGLQEGEQIYFQIVSQPTKLNKTAMRLARQSFRLMKSEINWLSVFLNQYEVYGLYLVPLFPILLLKLIVEVMKAFKSQQINADPMLSLPDSNPKKIYVEKTDLQEFNNRMAEKYKTPFVSYIRVAATGKDATEKLTGVEQALESMKSENQNRLTRVTSSKYKDIKTRFLYPEDQYFPFFRRLFTSQTILSSREVSMLYHLPIKINDPAIEYFSVPHISAKKQFRIPTSRHDLLLGENIARQKTHKVYLNENNRKRHLVVTGQTGTGKSTILKRLMLHDIDNRLLNGQKRGLMLLDPHEDFFIDILQRLPVQHSSNNSLVIWDTSDENYYFGFNPLFAVGLSEREIDLVVDSNFKLIEKLIKRLNPEGGMGATGKPMLINAMKTLMVFQTEWLKKHGETPENIKLISENAPTLLDIKSLFSDDYTRDTVKSYLDLDNKYPGLRSFWEETFLTFQSSKNYPEIVQGFDNKISQITTGTLLYTFAQSQNFMDISQIIRRSKILLVNLSSKSIGEEGMSLLGSLLMSKVWFEAKRIDQEKRRPFVVYADEFQNFATSDFAQVLSEARKFKLELVIAHQFFKQLPDDVFHAVLGNVKSKIYYRCGVEDAGVIFKEMQGKILPQELIEVPEYNANVKVGDELFSLYVAEERKPNFSVDYVGELINESYEKGAKTKAQIDEEVKRRRSWLRDGAMPNSA